MRKGSLWICFLLLVLLLSGCMAPAGPEGLDDAVDEATGARLTLGMTRAEVVDQLGEPEQWFYGIRYRELGLRFRFSDDRVAMITAENNSPYRFFTAYEPIVSRVEQEEYLGAPYFDTGEDTYYLLDEAGAQTDTLADAAALVRFYAGNEGMATSVQEIPVLSERFALRHKDGRTIALGMDRAALSEALGEEPQPIERPPLEWNEQLFEEKGFYLPMSHYGKSYLYPENGVVISAIGDYLIELGAVRGSPWLSCDLEGGIFSDEGDYRMTYGRFTYAGEAPDTEQATEILTDYVEKAGEPQYILLSFYALFY